MGRRVVVLIALWAAAWAAAAPSSAAGAAAAGPGPVPVLIVDGKGFGHGVWMAQDGAFWMGVGGATTAEILGHFYPGTGVGGAGGVVRVEVLPATAPDAVVAFPGGGEVRDALFESQSAGFPVRVGPGGSVRLSFDGTRYHAQVAAPGAGGGGGPGAGPAAGPGPGPPPPAGSSTSPTAPPSGGPPPNAPSSTTTTSTPLVRPPVLIAPPRQASPQWTPPTTQPVRVASTTTTTTAPTPSSSPTTAMASEPGSPRPLWTLPAGDAVTAVPARGRQYRGALEAVAAPGGIRLLDTVDVEQYLRGMGEVLDGSWPPAALRAQAIAARTYALRAMAIGGELCDDDRCQTYLGQQVEYPAMDRAIADTRGQVLYFGEAMAAAFYSTNGGGISASPREGFGDDTAAYPYLPVAPYVTRDVDPWTVSVALSDLASRFSYPGTVLRARIAQAGPSGRALAIGLDGSAGTATVDAHTFAAQLGLRSTLFTVRVGQADVAPPPPVAADYLQLPPGQLHAIHDASTAREASAPSSPAVLVTVRHRHRDSWVPWVGAGIVVMVAIAYSAEEAARRL